MHTIALDSWSKLEKSLGPSTGMVEESWLGTSCKATTHMNPTYHCFDSRGFLKFLGNVRLIRVGVDCKIFVEVWLGNGF